MAVAPPSRTAARRLPRDQRVAAIMRVAREVFGERGSEQFLTVEVAQRCGISEGTIYKYFATRRDLLIKVAEAWFEEFLGEQPPFSPSLPVRDRLFHVIWSSLSLIRREKALTRFVLMELRSDRNYRQMGIYELNRRIAAQVTAVVEDGIACGEMRGDIPLKLVRDMIFGCIEHQTWAYLRGEGDFSVEATAEGITDIVMRGIAGASVAPAPGEMAGVVARLEAVTQAFAKRLAALPE